MIGSLEFHGWNPPVRTIFKPRNVVHASWLVNHMHSDRFIKKIIKNIKITGDSSEWSTNREKNDFNEPDGQQYMADRPFSHVSTVIKKSYNFYHYKFIVDRKNVCIGAKNSASRKCR